MFRTIFSKLIAIIILILFIGFSITGGMLYYFLDSFLAQEKISGLEASSEKISDSFEIFYENRESPIAMMFLERTLELYSSYTSSLVWIVTQDGYIWISKPAMPEELVNKYGSIQNGFIRLPDERQYKKVMSGNVTIKEIGNFYGFFKDEVFRRNGEGESWLTLAKPLQVSLNGRNQTVAAVFLHTPVPEVQRARRTVFRFFEISVGVAVLISIILAYIFSRRITKPLKEISNASTIIAGGEFNKYLKIESQDEIGELAKNFNQMVAALQNLEEMRRGFIANVSHELRTPMTSIRGFIEGILDGTIPAEKQKDYLMIVREESIRLNKLVNDLLDLAKMEAGEVILSIREFDVNELVRRCIIKLENLIVTKDLQVEADFEEEELPVRADPDAIERVLYNLIHNAIKFTPETGKIQVCTSSKKERILVSVADTGTAISAGDLERIWDRFYKSDKSRGRDKTGTGLGLAIVKEIISEHGQEIWVESEPGKGTKFTFTLEKS